MARKILIIGIDGGTWKVLQPAIEMGYMPALKNLVETGSSGVLESTMPAITPAAWGTFQTGVNPGANGVYDFAFWDKNDKKQRFVSADSLSQTIWQAASIAGKRVGVLNVPMTYPPEKINGCMVSGILTPSLESDFTYPSKLKDELLEVVSDYHIFNLKKIADSDPHENFEDFVRQTTQILESRTRAAEFIINKEPLDIFMVHFQASDVILHAMWGYLDENGPMYDSEKRGFIFDNFFRKLDEHIRTVQQAFERSAGGDYLTMIVSDHGFQTHKKRINLGNWLCDGGFLKLNTPTVKRPLLKKITRNLGIGTILKLLFSKNTFSKMEKRAGLTPQPFCWEGSEAFSMGRSGEGFIYLLAEEKNRRKKAADTIIEKLKGLRDPETNAPVVKNVYRREEIFTGRWLETMPDLVIEPEDGYSFTGAYGKDQPLFHNISPGTDFHIGKHHKDGIIIAGGKDIRNQKSVHAKLIDIAPTLLYYLNLPISRKIEGRVLSELFTDDFTNNNPISEIIDDKTKTERLQRHQYNREDENEIQQRLKDLGYM